MPDPKTPSPDGKQSWDSKELLGETGELIILHYDGSYVLRRTEHGELELHKVEEKG